jgi:hypothetical protein
MSKRRLKGSLLAVAAGLIFCLLSGARLWAQNSDLAIIVNAKNPVSNVTMSELRKIFTAEHRSWDGKEIVLMVPPPDTPERAIMLHTIYRMNESQYKELWLGKSFRGEVTSAPVAVASRQLANDAAASMTNAVACLPARDVYSKGVKILKVEGHLPGEAGYPVN